MRPRRCPWRTALPLPPPLPLPLPPCRCRPAAAALPLPLGRCQRRQPSATSRASSQTVLPCLYRIAEAEKEGYGEMYETPLFDEVTGRPLNDKARKLVGQNPTGEQNEHSGGRRRCATKTTHFARVTFCSTPFRQLLAACFGPNLGSLWALFSLLICDEMCRADLSSAPFGGYFTSNQENLRSHFLF